MRVESELGVGEGAANSVSDAAGWGAQFREANDAPLLELLGKVGRVQLTILGVLQRLQDQEQLIRVVRKIIAVPLTAVHIEPHWVTNVIVTKEERKKNT